MVDLVRFIEHYRLNPQKISQILIFLKNVKFFIMNTFYSYFSV